MEYGFLPMTDEEEEKIDRKFNDELYVMIPPEPGTPDKERFVLKVMDGERFAGGCVVGIMGWGRAVLMFLWVDKDYRNHGLASMLIREAEKIVSEKGCYIMCLGTMDIYCRGLYEKHGYRVFTLNRDIPRGHEGYSMGKRLDRGIPGYIPTDNTADERFSIVSGNDEDIKIIKEGLAAHDRLYDLEDKHEYIDLNYKLVDGNGEIIAAIVMGVDGDDEMMLDTVWVREDMRNRGIGSYLLSKAEEEAKKYDAYVSLTGCTDASVGFLLKNGYTLRGELEDYPKGHHSFELQKYI